MDGPCCVTQHMGCLLCIGSQLFSVLTGQGGWFGLGQGLIPTPGTTDPGGEWGLGGSGVALLSHVSSCAQIEGGEMCFGA